MSEPTIRYGRHLWELLPQRVRTRDADVGFDLLAVVDAIGGELDRLRGTLDQRLAEVVPGATLPVHQLHPDDPVRESQQWLLPYFAALLDVRLTAPTADGQRVEVQEAIAWHKGKGTTGVAEEAAERMLQGEVELLEGRAIVAVTPRVDAELLPESSFTLQPVLGPAETWRRQPLAASRHPGLPTVTPTVTGPGRAVTTTRAHPLARARELPGGGDDVVWRHLDRRAAPCFPHSHEDVAPRTPDVRLASTRAGWHHPKTLVALTAPPPGFFDPDAPAWPVPADPAPVRNDADPADPEVPLAEVSLTAVTVTAGQLRLGPATVDGPIEITAPGTHHLVDVVQTGDARVVSGPGVTIEAHRCALGVLTVRAGAVDGDRGALPAWPVRPEPVDASDALVAVDCLLGEVDAIGRVTLDRCTVLGPVAATTLRTADTVLAAAAITGAPADSCLRHSRVPDGLPADVRLHRTTTARALFDRRLDCPAGDLVVPGWGEPGCGVLHADCPAAITSGAEDGGEMGAYHHRHHVGARAAVAAKLADLLPVGITPIAVPDVRLLTRPPQEP